MTGKITLIRTKENTLKTQILGMFLLIFGAVAAAQSLANPLTNQQVINAWITNTETHVVQVAEAMPDNKYTFTPTHGAFKNVRTFAEQLKHLSANNYSVAAKIMGESPTPDQASEQGPDSVQTKTQIVEYVKGSFVALHQAVATINDKNEAEPLKGMSGTWQRARLGLAIDAVAHSFDHYGQLVEYLRMNGIIPPGSR